MSYSDGKGFMEQGHLTEELVNRFQNALLLVQYTLP